MRKIIPLCISLLLVLFAILEILKGGVDFSNIIVGVAGIVSTVYTALDFYATQEDRKSAKTERERQEKIHKKQIEPVIDFGLSVHGDGSDTPMVEVTVSDPKEMLRNEDVSIACGNFNGLNIGKRGQKCLPHQFRIAARVPKDDNGVIKFYYEDIEGNPYEKYISWNPTLDVRNKL